MLYEVITVNNIDLLSEVFEKIEQSEEMQMSLSMSKSDYDINFSKVNLPKSSEGKRFEDNIEVISILKNGTTLSAEDKKKLASYIGFGGLSEAVV